MTMNYETMTVTMREIGYLSVVEFIGKLDNRNLNSVNRLCIHLMTKQVSEFVFDLSKVLDISNAVMTMFVNFGRKIREAGGRFFIMKLNPHIADKIARVKEHEDKIGYFADEEEAEDFILHDNKYL
ncbi:MAG: hypothetical protein A2268_08835 [Candidatus Raymondbacteria bacterium RifOxyA12_full_50_37]|uniref:STAS domain-containing protein n=1 Tax=Candidatus Raymondbacteria bacterium RIFOXYD12_FULL_49_13 TaxID=1817890 RepID=A0A1F7FG77_UNCRA|nr:MAG: hypothetical protein A2350_19755 [Candidatus Raymondbacteria bacterium RifOxyB12_full_50_8]OGJ91598.1 MAG: hypothetical protein A2268_08835 [Candidatus Raymondbacteria bacterium RifOxyA12_full_50_37]OGJ92904.1 MAG: hypothetical protein A2248_08535 [Candidatus Raymondbacteria bacterium RIFOXYA2_FULL_49_16]OGJ94831.1 MAG: hypothetical protein A2487_03235 [Candidatus Raymondbacteria bacterium RifOxyC12_full_50_8]OGK05710.1 MAG: hypothetical protein A2519_03935 [Candidatus Raymondbacteria b